MPDFGRPDFGRPDFGRPDFERSQEPSLDDVRRTDSFIDALAGGRPVLPQDPADAELATLLGNWRDELRWPPATGLLSDADVTAAFNAGRSQKRSGPDPQRWTDTRMRNRRSLSVIGASAAAVLCIGGFGAVVAGSGPGDALYGVRTMLFGGQKQVRDDQIGLAAKTELNQVQTLISQGDWQEAQDKLVAVSTQVATIGDQEQKQELLDQFNDLSAKVVERDPAATAPPGVVYTVPPSSAALVPAVEPTSSASPATSTTPETSSSSSASTTSPPTSAATSSPTTSSPTTSSPTTSSPTTSSPTTSSAATSAATSTSDSAPSTTFSATSTTPAPNTSAAPQSQPTTTPTSAPPSATTAPPSADGASTAASPTSVGSSPEAPRAVSSTPAPAPTTVSQTPAAAPSPAPESAPATAVESAPASAAITTSVVVPAPAAP